MVAKREFAKKNRKKNILSPIFLLSVMAMVFGLAGSAQAYTYITLDVPGSWKTAAYGINDSGDIVGMSWTIPSLYFQAFKWAKPYDGSTLTPLNVQGNTETIGAYDINDSGDIVGEYLDHDDNNWYGFIYDGTTSTWTALAPCANSVAPFGINDSSNIVCGNFVYDGSKWTTLAVPGAISFSAHGINDSGDIVGEYNDGNGTHGFKAVSPYNNTDYTTLDVVGANGTYAHGINNSGVIVGSYYDGSNLHGFVYDGTTYTPLDVNIPGVTDTQAYGINDSGVIVGKYYIQGLARDFGFIAACEGGDPSRGNNGSSAGCTLCSGIGEPINTFTGELYEPLPMDINLGGPMPLVFQRYYAAFLRRSFVVGDLGSNWRHNFDARLFISGNTAKYISFQGRVTDFVKNLVSGVWEQQTNLDTTYKLTKPAGQNASLFDPQDNLIYTFDFTTNNVIIGKLATVKDGKGNVHTVSYDLASGQIQSVSDGLGRSLNFSYNANAIAKISIVSDGSRSVQFQYTDAFDTEYLTQVIDVRGGLTTYTYENTSANADHALMKQWMMPRGNVPFTQVFDALGRVTTQTDADGNVLGLAYGVPGANQTTLTDPLGVDRVHSAEASGAFNGMQDQAGQSFSLATDANGRRNSLTDRLGGTTTVTYHAPSGKLAGVTNADGTTENFTYVPRTVSGLTLHDMSGATNADGTTISMIHDAFGNLTSRTDELGNIATFTYNGLGQVLSATNKLLGVITNTYNADGTLATTMDPAVNSTLFGYDLLKRPVLTTYADGSTSSITYDAANHLLTATDENGNTTTITYDANGNLVTSQDPLFNTNTFTYDGNDRLVSTTDPLGGVSSRTYHPLGEVGTTTDANGNTTTMGYNALGRLTSITDSLGNIWQRSYDAEAIITSRADPLGNTTNFVSNKMGRITQTTSPLGSVSKVSYDAMGRVATTTDPLNQVTTFTRDLRGQVTGISLPGGTISSTIIRNAVGEPASITDPNGNAWNRSYDTSGRLTSSTDPLGQARITTYDNRNQPSVITLPGALGTQTLGYDATGNATSVNYSGGTAFGFSYDANNRLTAANSGGVTPNNVSRSYDANGRISNSNGIAITRDVGGRITGMTLAAGKAVTYAYDANDNLATVTDWAGGITTFTYDNAGRLTGISRPNGVNQTNTWDNDSRLTGIIEGAVSTISLSRDANGQITSATRAVPTVASAATQTGQANTYDAASQIVGNTYDASGRRTAAGADIFTWDDASRLTAYTVGGTTAANVYDSFGRRISRTVGANTVDYVWNDVLGLPSISVEQRNAADFRYFVHTPAGDLLYSIDAATNLRKFYHYDEMGNTIFITGDAGTVIGSYAYTPFGQLITSTGALDNPFTWQGQNGIMDDGNGLYYVRARYYDANTGRFISRDAKKSIAPKRMNPYQYALNNPLMFVDTSGEEPGKDKTKIAKGSTRTDKAEREARIKHMRGRPKPKPPKPFLEQFSKDANKFLDWVSNGLNPGSPGIEDVVIVVLKAALTIPKNISDAEKIVREIAKINAETERVEARRLQKLLKRQAERNAKAKEARQLLKDRAALEKAEFQNALIEGQAKEGLILP